MILGQGIKVLVKGIWKSLESEFQVTLDSLSRLTSLLEAEITLAHRGYVKGDIEEQKPYRKQTCQTLDKLLQTSSHKPTERQDQNKCINLEGSTRPHLIYVSLKSSVLHADPADSGTATGHFGLAFSCGLF